MANINPKDFNDSSETTGSEIFPLYQSGWKKLSLTSLKNWLSGFFSEATHTHSADVITTALTGPLSGYADVQSALTQIDHLLTVVHYEPTSIVTTDTYTGILADLYEFGGNSITINEASGVGFNFQLNFDGVEAFTLVHLHERYWSVAGPVGGHTISFDVYNWKSGLWEVMLSHSGVQSTLTLGEWKPDPSTESDYVSLDANKRVSIRAIHGNTANSNHRLTLDHVIISHNMLTGSEVVTSHNGLSGKELPNQHPATSISYTNTTSGLTATTTQAAIDEIAGVQNMTINYDKVSQTLAYVGKAVTGSDPAAAVWQIKRINPTDPLAPILYAGGSQAFTSVWVNRAELGYS